MAEELLDAAKVRPARKELGGEGVAHGVGRDRGVEPRRGHVLLEGAAQGVRAHPPPAGREEERPRGVIGGLLGSRGERRARLGYVAGDPFEGVLVHGDDPLLRALAEEPHLRRGKIHGGDVERARLRDAGAAGVEELEERAVPQAGGGRDVAALEQARGLGVAHGLREAARDLGARDRRGGPARLHATLLEPRVQPADRGEPSVDGGRRVPGAGKLGEVGAQFLMGRREGVDAFALGPAGKIGEVRGVPLGGVLRKPPHHGELRHEGIYIRVRAAHA